MKFENDKRIVLTLDAGGTNFIYSAIQGNEEIVQPIRLPSHADDLTKCLQTIVEGFERIQSSLHEKVSAISFAFPGPADYPSGVIGDLGNLPAFRGGVALGPMLQDKFSLPVFINNDGDLFAIGEAIAGFLPEVNQLLERSGSEKRYSNLFGMTLGTGFGGGIVCNGRLYIGDNSAGGEIWAMRNKLHNHSFVEEGASIRAVKRVYAEKAGINLSDTPEPKEIYEIALCKTKGDQSAAMEAFRQLGETVGDALANTLTLLDGLIVIGGGLAGAHSVFLPVIVDELNSAISTLGGDLVSRMEVKAFNLEDPKSRQSFYKGGRTMITVPMSDRYIPYDPMKRIGVGITKLGTSKAVSIGAYVFALNQLDS